MHTTLLFFALIAIETIFYEEENDDEKMFS